MISREKNPDFVNDFLDYSSTILNKSNNTIKEYNYDIAHFLKFIRYKFKEVEIESEEFIKEPSPCCRPNRVFLRNAGDKGGNRPGFA